MSDETSDERADRFQYGARQKGIAPAYGFDEDKGWDGADYGDTTEDSLDRVWVEARARTLKEGVAVVVWRSLSGDASRRSRSARTVEVLTVELLNKLEHHAVQRTLPQVVTSGEAFQPGRLSAVVFRLDTELKLIDNFDNEEVVFGYAIKLCDDLACLCLLSGTEQMTSID